MNIQHQVYERCNFTCTYCGYDGRAFDSWMQLSIDHILPRSCGGSDDLSNLVAACGSCNSITGRMKFPKEMTLEAIVRQKRKYVADSRAGYYQFWMEQVAPKFLEREVPAPILLP